MECAGGGYCVYYNAGRVAKNRRCECYGHLKSLLDVNYVSDNTKKKTAGLKVIQSIKMLITWDFEAVRRVLHILIDNMNIDINIRVNHKCAVCRFGKLCRICVINFGTLSDNMENYVN